MDDNGVSNWIRMVILNATSLSDSIELCEDLGSISAITITRS